MKKNRDLRRRWNHVPAVIVLLAVLLTGLSAERFAIVSHAESEGKVTANSAKIRQEPSTDSTPLGSALKDAKVSIKGEVTGSDGNIWYQVFVDADTLGYIRSDLVQITDGSTLGAVTPSDGTAPDAGPDEALVNVTAVSPVNASVTGGQAVRVRQNASTTSRIVTTAQSGQELTVTGTAAGTDGNEWYQVSYISNGSEVSGFIRWDYIELSGELVPISTDVPPQDEPAVDTGAEPAQPEPAEKDWDTFYGEEKWHLINNATGESYDIESIFKISNDNKQIAQDAMDAQKKQQVVIIILVILLIGLAGLVTYLIFKIKDMMDSAYFSEVERETMRRRTADRPQGSGQKVMHTVGEEKKQAGQRPAGQRPGGGNGGGQGQRPAGQRPSGGNSGNQGQRSSGGNGGGQGQRPAGQRPSGGNSGNQGQRSSGGNGGQGQRPAGQRPGGGNGGGQGQRPAGQRSEQAKSAPQEQGWKSKNFMADDDDDFKFLDWDETDDK